MPSTPTPLAYSYIRFSHPDQAKGDSLRRQTEAAADWCEHNHVTLDLVFVLPVPTNKAGNSQPS